jgi:tRNA(Ile2) C34 agmatinyltransferase TiaS
MSQVRETEAMKALRSKRVHQDRSAFMTKFQRQQQVERRKKVDLSKAKYKYGNCPHCEYPLSKKGRTVYCKRCNYRINRSELIEDRGKSS